MATTKDEFLKELADAFGPAEDLETKRSEIADRLGTKPGEISVIKDVLSTKLSRGGVILNPHIGRTRFTVQLDPEDLGLKVDDPDHKDFIERYTELGQKFLLDSEYLRKLDRIDRGIRRVVENNGFLTAYGYFVPYTIFNDVKMEIEALEREYFQVRDEILDMYDDCLRKTEDAYGKAAVKAFQLLHMSPDAIPSDEFVEKFVGRVMLEFPSYDKIKESFKIRMEVSYVPLTTFVEEQAARQRLIVRKESLIAEELQLEEGELAYKRRRFEELNREAIENYKRQMDEFIADVVGQTYTLIYDAVEAVRKQCAKYGTLNSGDVKRLRTMVAKVKKLNLFESKEVSKYITELENILDTNSKFRDKDDVYKVLRDITVDTRMVMNLLGCQPRSIRGRASTSVEVSEIEAEPVNDRRQRRFEAVPGSSGTVLSVPEPVHRAERYA